MDYKKTALRLSVMLLTGLFVSLFLYPFMHETGHFIAAAVSGAKINDLRFFPVPYIVCNVAEMNKVKICIIGLSGLIFPFFISIIAPFKTFFGWLVLFFLRFVSALSFVLSYISVLFFESGIVWKNEDIIKIIQLSEVYNPVWLFLCFLFLTVSFFTIYNMHPVKKLRKYFDV